MDTDEKERGTKGRQEDLGTGIFARQTNEKTGQKN
jgi:hypothetical protein